MKYIQKDINLFRKNGKFYSFLAFIRLVLDSVPSDFYFLERILKKEKQNILLKQCQKSKEALYYP
tara:strand:- start:631 stop:825 length:195 start_codon:yes stop_codon:yes gene_type:complete